MNQPKKSFAGLGRDIIQDTQPKANLVRKPTHVNFVVDEDLVQGFELNLAWGGPNYKRKDVMNAALRYYLENNAEAKKRAATPFPGLGDTSSQ